MNKVTVEKLLSNHRVWFGEFCEVKHYRHEWWLITTPFLDYHNDCLEVEFMHHTSGLIQLISNDAIDVIDDSPPAMDKIYREIDPILAGLAVYRYGKQLTVSANFKEFPEKFNRFIQAVIAANTICSLQVLG